MTKEEIENIFTHHAPKGDQVERYVALRSAAKMYALLVNELCPESREKSLAITKIQESVMCANCAIAINE